MNDLRKGILEGLSIAIFLTMKYKKRPERILPALIAATERVQIIQGKDTLADSSSKQTADHYQVEVAQASVRMDKLFWSLASAVRLLVPRQLFNLWLHSKNC
jgi:hypothetical protein